MHHLGVWCVVWQDAKSLRFHTPRDISSLTFSHIHSKQKYINYTVYLSTLRHFDIVCHSPVMLYAVFFQVLAVYYAHTYHCDDYLFTRALYMLITK